MRDDDVSEVAVVLDGVRFSVEARQDSMEHEVSSTLAAGLGAAMDAIKTLGSPITDAVKTIEPDHFGIQLGFEFKLEQGAPLGDRLAGPDDLRARARILHARLLIQAGQHEAAADLLGRTGQAGEAARAAPDHPGPG